MLVMVSVCGAADDMEKLRDRQDRSGLEKNAAALEAAAENVQEEIRKEQEEFERNLELMRTEGENEAEELSAEG